MRLDTILNGIGDTDHVRLNAIFGSEAEVWMKLERENPGGSIKDRIALSMIEDAERRGVLTKDSLIVEPTSGNTGVGLAMVAAVKGYDLLLVMPESMSLERRRLMALYGARLELTPREGGMKGAIDRARELADEIEGAWMPMQFDNPANVAVHEEVTAREILEDFPEGLDALVTGVGTGGHITGVARALKARMPELQVIAVEPAASPVLGGGSRDRTRSRASAGASFRVSSTRRCSTVSRPWRPTTPSATPCAARARRGSSWGSPRAPRWPPSPSDFPRSGRARGS